MVALALVCGRAFAADLQPTPSDASGSSAAVASTTRGRAPRATVRTTHLSAIEVVGTTPLAGVGISLNKVPQNVQAFDTGAVSRQGSPSLISTLENQASSVSINDDAVDPFQPDILYRGFSGSSVLGTSEGLAVYQNGVRINEAFGDTVNWDLVPSLAIQHFQISGSNPVYGLNALGGAIVLTMKNGFNYHGFDAEFAGGSFSQHEESMQFGGEKDGYSVYLAGNLFGSDGWRKFSPNHVQQLYADFGKRWSRGEAHITFAGASNRLDGAGTTPAQSLAISRRLDFTGPQANDNSLAFVTASGSYDLTDYILLQAEGYRRAFNQSVANGNNTSYLGCASDPALMCQPDGNGNATDTRLLQANGQPIPNLANGLTDRVMGEDDGETIGTISIGGTLQGTDAQDVFGHENNFVFGASVDHSNTNFASFAQLGLLSQQLVVEASPYFVDTPESVANANGFTATPVGLHAGNTSLGLYFSDTFNVTKALALTASGRYNNLQVNLHDQRGTDLTGDNRYTRFNPAFGAAYTFSPELTAYAGYAEGNRAPTPGEIECSNPDQPCLLPSSLSGDPPTLKQVVSRTVELGVRGRFRWQHMASGLFTWNLGVYRTKLFNPIYPEQVTNTELFDVNIGGIRNQGLEAGLSYQSRGWRVFGSYSLVDATFTSPFVESSPSNPVANADGEVQVRSGDRQPGIPENQIKVGADYFVTAKWAVGAVLNYFSSQYLLGDESNQNMPLPGYVVMNLHSSYQIMRHVSLFANLSNVFDNHYNTFGQYSDATGVFAPGVVDDSAGEHSRFYGPAPPIAVFGGVKIHFS